MKRKTARMPRSQRTSAEPARERLARQPVRATRFAIRVASVRIALICLVSTCPVPICAVPICAAPPGAIAVQGQETNPSSAVDGGSRGSARGPAGQSGARSSSERIERPINSVEVGQPNGSPSGSAVIAKQAPLLLPPRATGSPSLTAPAAQRGRSTATVIGSLGLVIGLFLLVAWLLRRAAPRQNAMLPADVVQVLGRAPMAGRQMMQLVRIGNKLVLVCVSAAGASAITEITDSAEVERLCGICERQSATSISATFRHVMRQFGDERSSPGFLGDERRAELGLAADGHD